MYTRLLFVGLLAFSPLVFAGETNAGILLLSNLWSDDAAAEAPTASEPAASPCATQDERAAAVTPGLPWRGSLPTPDGVIDVGDRIQTAGLVRVASAVLIRRRLAAVGDASAVSGSAVSGLAESASDTPTAAEEESRRRIEEELVSTGQSSVPAEQQAPSAEPNK